MPIHKEGTLTRVRFRKDTFLIATIQTKDNALLTIKGDAEIVPDLGDHLSGMFDVVSSPHGPTWDAKGHGLIKVEHPKYPEAIKQRFADLAKKAGIRRTKKLQEEVEALEATGDAWMALMTLTEGSEAILKMKVAFEEYRNRMEAKSGFVEMVQYLRGLGIQWKESSIKTIFGYKADCETPDALPITVAELQDDPFRLFEVAKLRKQQWEEYSRVLQQTGDLDKESHEHTQLVLALKQQEEEGHTCIPLRRVKFAVNPENRIFQRFLELHEGYLFRKATFHQEHGIAEILADCLVEEGHPFLAVTEEEVRTAPVEFTPTAEQCEAVIKMLTERVQIVLGSAGTGKTTTLKLLLSTLRKKGQEQYMLLAPTGKAVQRIRESVGSYIPPDCPERIQTIHKFAFRLETYYRDKLVRKTEAQVPSFVEQVPPLVVVDEMSMVDNHTFYLLLYHLRRLCTEEGAEFPHLILIGDTNQLGPIGCGEPLLSMIDSGLVPVHRLTQIQRQKEGGLMDFVNTVRDYAIPTSGKDCILLPVSHATLETRVKAWIDAHPAYRIGETAAIICPTNAMCETVSLVARNYVNPQVGVGTIRYATESYGFVRVGDKVIQIKNNYTENVFNGSVGRVLDIKHEQRSGDIMREYVVVEFPTGIRYYTKEDVYDELDLAFALTTHKSQGSEYVHVLFLLEHIPMFVSGNLIYTAVSRAQTSLTVLTWEGSLEQCRRVPRRRYVYLANFLAEQVETEEKECG